MWGTAYERYGRDFLRTFNMHWPASARLLVVTDEPLAVSRGEQKPLAETGYPAFLERWGDNRKAQGYDSQFSKLDAEGRSWKTNAVKWAPQAFAAKAAVSGMRAGDILVWLDADVETIKAVPETWVAGLLGDADLACLRRPTHTEIGFYAMRIDPKTRAILRDFADIYTSGEFLEIRESHSAYVFDRAVERHNPAVRDLNTEGVKFHPWPQSPLAECTVHKKGKLKGA